MAIILDSTYGTVKKHTWGRLTNHKWQDFALVVMEANQELEVKGIRVDRGTTELYTDTDVDVNGVMVEYLRHRLILSSDSEVITSIFVSSTDFYEFLMYQLPWYDKINLTFQSICEVLDISFRYLEEKCDQVRRNTDIDRMIELLGYMEKLLGIKTNKDLSYTQRRSQIKAVLRARFEQTTENAIKDIMRSFSANNSGVEIFKVAEPWTFEIRFISGGLPQDLEEVENLLKKLIPADEKWYFTYTQNTWDMATNKGRIRWRDLEPYTWLKVNQYVN